MHIPDVEALPAEREGAFVTDSTPREQRESGLTKCGGEFLQGGSASFQAGLAGNDAPLMWMLLPETQKLDVIPQDLVVPEKPLEVVQWQRVVHEGCTLGIPTDGVAAGGGFGVFEPAPVGLIERDIVLAPTFPQVRENLTGGLRRQKLPTR